MVGECGTSRSGTVHHYYKCTNAKRHGGCRKKAIKKGWIENLVVLEIRKKLEDARFIDDIVHAFIEFQTAENTVIPHLKQSLAELNKSIDNILAAIEQGIFTQSTKQRLEELESKKKDIEIEIAKESIRRPLLNEDQVRFWFERLRNLNINELSHRKRLIDTFLNSVFVYDDKLLINCNYPNTSTIVRFSDINATLNGSDILACGRPNGTAVFLAVLFLQTFSFQSTVNSTLDTTLQEKRSIIFECFANQRKISTFLFEIRQNQFRIPCVLNVVLL